SSIVRPAGNPGIRVSVCELARSTSETRNNEDLTVFSGTGIESNEFSIRRPARSPAQHVQRGQLDGVGAVRTRNPDLGRSRTLRVEYDLAAVRRKLRTFI